MGQDLGIEVSTIVYFIKGIFEFTHKYGVPATKFPLNIWVYFREVVDNR